MHRPSWRTLSAVCALLAAVPAPAAAQTQPSGAPAGATVRVQTGDHAEGFSRLVVRVPNGARASVTRGNCGGRIGLDTAAAWPLNQLNGTFSERLSGYRAEDDRTLSFSWPCGAQVRTTRERSLLIVDVLGAPTPPRKPGGVPRAAEATERPIATAAPTEARVSDAGPDRPIRLMPPAAAAEPSRPAAPLPAPPPAKATATGSAPPSAAPREDVAAAVRRAVQDTVAALERSAPPAGQTKPAAPDERADATAVEPPPPIGPFDLAGWAGTDFRERDRELQSAASEATGTARADALIALARFRLAWAMPEEGRAVLETAGALHPSAPQTEELRLLTDAFAVLDGTADPDSNAFVRPGAASSPDHAVWRAAALAPMRWPLARRDLPTALKRLRSYPVTLRGRLLDRFAEAAGGSDPASLELVVLEMLTLDSAPGDGRLDLHRGRLAELRGQTDAALALYDRAALGDGSHARRAQVRAVELRRAANQLDDASAIAALESLRYAWRGDTVEAEALAALGQAYIRAGRTDAALDVFALLGRRFGSTARGQSAASAARDLLATLIERLEAGPPGVDSLALQIRHGVLVGRVDDAKAGLRRRLADLLVRDGFVLEGARAYHALIEEARGAERAELGARLARTLIDAGRPDEAQETLARTGDPAVPADLAARRALLRGEAQLAEGDPLGAMDAVRGLPGAEAARLRASGLFRAGEWAAARTAFAEVADGPDGKPDDIALLALAAYRAGDPAALSALAATHRAALKPTRWAGLLDALTDDAPPAGPVSGPAIDRQLAAADALAGLYARWSAKPPAAENPR